MINFKALALTTIIALGGVATGNAAQAGLRTCHDLAHNGRTAQEAQMECVDKGQVYQNSEAWWHGAAPVRSAQTQNTGVPIFAILGTDTSSGYNGPQSVSGTASGCGSNTAIPNEFGGYDCW